MSLIIGMHCGRYVMFGTDTRAVTCGPSGVIGRAHDGYKKIYQTHAGLITGSGVTSLFETVIRRFSSAATFDALLAIIAEEQQQQPASPPCGTSWMFSYTANERVECALYSPGLGHKFVAFNPGMIVPFVPGSGDERRGVERDLGEQLVSEVRICGPDDSIDESIARHTDLLRRRIAAVSSQWGPRDISPDTSIGVHTDAGDLIVRAFPPLREAGGALGFAS